MMIQQIEHKYSEEHIMESTTVNKKNTARTICAIIGGIIVLNLQSQHQSGELSK